MKALADFLTPARLFFKLLAYSAVPGLAIAIATFWHNSNIYIHDVRYFFESFSFIVIHGLNLLLANFTAKFAQATMVAYFGGRVEKIGLRLVFHCYPRFYHERRPILHLEKRAQLWCFAIPIVSRLLIAVWGGVFWYMTRGTGTILPLLVLALAQISLLDILFDGNPLVRGDAYFFMVVLFGLPENFLQRSWQLWRMVAASRPLPLELSTKKKVTMLFYFPASIMATLGLFGVLIFHIAEGINSTFPGIFGRATSVIFLSALIVLALLRPLRRMFAAKRQWQEN